jgi:5'-3' exonuclease
VLRAPNTEADDLIAGTVHANARVHRRIVSTDRDFLQLIGPKISVYAPVKKLVIDDANFAECVTPKDAAGHLSPAVYLDYRALIGDPSDTLPGVPGVGSLSAVKLLVSAPLDSYDGEPAAVRAALGRKSEAVERAFADGSAAEIIARNRTLMDLRLPAPCWDELDALTTRGAWDRSRFEAWLEEQRFSGVDQPALLARLESLAATTAKTNR